MATARTASTVSALIVAAALGQVDEHQGEARANETVKPSFERLRTDDRALADSIAKAAERSSTFRRLVNEALATDGIVTVERGQCRLRLPACLLFWMGNAGPNRILRVVISDRLQGDETTVLLAHELTHALEVLREPGVRSGSEMYFLFKRIGAWQGDVFETQSAEDVEAAVRRELMRTRK